LTHDTLTKTEPQTDIYSRITNQILADLERGELTWRKPWNADHLAGHVMRPLRWNGIPYSGINVLVLWASAAEKGYASPYWMTFKQAGMMGAVVRKGEKGTHIVYADHLLKEEAGENGQTNTRKIPFLKSYTVFNTSQLDNVPPGFDEVPAAAIANPDTRLAEIEQFFAHTRADIVVGAQASYTITTDRIQMPPFESFEDATSYYATLAHELTHWTRHPTRLNRDLGRQRYGDEGYAKEELVAELGACFLAADLGIEPMPQERHAAYIQSWLEVLQHDKRFVFSAASLAQKAAEHIWKLQPAPLAPLV
jgi:antirestriction protein ArdC